MKARVAVIGTVGKSLLIDTNATDGATIGTNLFLADGTVPTLEQLKALFGSDEAPAVASTLWKLIGEIPPNVTEVELLATSGFVVRQVDGNWITRSLAIEADGLLQLAQPAGESGNPTLGAADIAALSVWGRASNTAGKPAPITAAADTTLLRRSGTAVGFGTITSAYVSDFTEAAQDAVFGVIADSARIDFAYDDPLNAFTADLIAGSVANTYLANMAQGTIKGRASGAGTGAPTDLSGAQVATIIGYTAADVLAKLITVDGAGSLLDADFLDGLTSAAFALAVHSHAIADVTGLSAALALKLDASSYTAADVLAKLVTVDGSGSGLDADLLDNISSAGFLQTATYQGLTPTWTQPHTFLDSITLASVAIPAGLVGGGVGSLVVGATTTGAISAFQYGAVPHLNLHRTNGTPGTETAILSAQQLGMLRFTGNYSTGTFYSGAEWIGVATENWSTTNRGSRLDAYVTKLATNSLTRILQLSQESFVALENTESPQIMVGASTGTAFAATNGITIIATTTNLFRTVTRAGAASFQSIRINGTSAAPTAIVSADILGQWTARGATDTTPTIGSGALVTFQATENWSGSQRGCKLLLQSVANGGTTASTTLLAHGTQAQFLDGTVSLPSLAFQNDLGLGIYRIGSNNMGLASNATLALAIDSVQRVYGTALHNNASSPTGTTNQYMASGTYTPTGTIVTNLDAWTPGKAQWIRVGNVVSVSGLVDADPTAAGAARGDLSFPLASNIAVTGDCAGTGAVAAVAGFSAAIRGSAGSDRAIVEWTAVDITSRSMSYHYTYEIL